MKRLITVSAGLLLATATYAQSADSDNSLYRFNNSGDAKEVHRLGTAPEFPFLRNKTTAEQVYNAIKKQDREHGPGMRKLNHLLMQIGYTNGAQDLNASDITMAYVPPGTEGNMGSRGYTYGYYRLEGPTSEFKAWKIAANTSSSTGSTNAPLYILAKCGNAFYPKNNATACISVPVQVTPNVKQIDLKSSGTKSTTNEEVFVYYERNHHHRHATEYPISGLNDRFPSRPIMLSDTKDVNVMPETYTVSLSSPDNTVSACPETTLNVTANVNLEKTSAYTGNYPTSDNKVYQKVSKREYRMIARRMRRIHRKEDKIARRTGMNVDVSVKA